MQGRTEWNCCYKQENETKQNSSDSDKTASHPTEQQSMFQKVYRETPTEVLKDPTHCNAPYWIKLSEGAGLQRGRDRHWQTQKKRKKKEESKSSRLLTCTRDLLCRATVGRYWWKSVWITQTLFSILTAHSLPCCLHPDGLWGGSEGCVFSWGCLELWECV